MEPFVAPHRVRLVAVAGPLAFGAGQTDLAIWVVEVDGVHDELGLVCGKVAAKPLLMFSFWFAKHMRI